MLIKTVQNDVNGAALCDVSQLLNFPSTSHYTTFYLTCVFRPSEKIFPDLDENLPLGVVFFVDHESGINFSIRDRDQG